MKNKGKRKDQMCNRVGNKEQEMLNYQWQTNTVDFKSCCVVTRITYLEKVASYSCNDTDNSSTGWNKIKH